MALKDWFMLLIPVFCNGVVVFLLQKAFEKSQKKQTIQNEYYSQLRVKVDVSLELHAKLTRIANEGDTNKDDIINVMLQKLFDSCLDVYYFYVQNESIFSAVDKECKELSTLLMRISKGVNGKTMTADQLSDGVNDIRDCLQEIKKTSMR